MFLKKLLSVIPLMPHILINLSQIKFGNDKFGIGKTLRKELISSNYKKIFKKK